jgi:hypothetical protein
MRGIVKELLTAFMVLTMAYLLLVHFTGFAADVKAAGSSANSLWRTAQGR